MRNACLASVVVLLSGCTSRSGPGPIHRCPVADWAQYESSCTCDPQSLGVHEGEIIDRGTMVGLIAPPGSFPPGAAVVIHHGGETSETFVRLDGSLMVYVSNGDGYDLRGRQASVHVGGSEYTVTLDAYDEVHLVPAGVDPRFAPDQLAIEDPLGTIAVSARVRGWSGSVIEHFQIGTFGPSSDWFETPPSVGDVVTWSGLGEEGQPLGFVALHASGIASGCYYGGRGGLGVCGCSVERVASGQCRHVVAAPDAGVDAGVIDAGPPGDGGAPF